MVAPICDRRLGVFFQSLNLHISALLIRFGGKRQVRAQPSSEAVLGVVLHRTDANEQTIFHSARVFFGVHYGEGYPASLMS